MFFRARWLLSPRYWIDVERPGGQPGKKRNFRGNDVKSVVKSFCTAALMTALSGMVSPVTAVAQEASAGRVAEYVHWYPAIRQTQMRDEWLAEHRPGEWQVTGVVTAKDRTVITPQADVNYGYSWFNISNEPVVITMPAYDRYYSLSVFDMHHHMEVFVTPDKPVVVRLPSQQSPLQDAHEVVLQTYQGLVFTRQVVVDNEAEVLALAEQMSITGGGGTKPFIVPEFTSEETEAGDKVIQEYALRQPGARRLFGSPYEGVGDLDRAAGVFLGQLGTQFYIVDYAQYLVDQHGESLTGTSDYEMVVPASLPLVKDDKGYWNFTIYSMEDRYLIPNDQGKHVISSYTADENEDGSVTIRVNPQGNGDNALPTAGQRFYGVFRVYQPVDGVEFPKLKKVD